jgi:glycosyltransferase involved in cell wall biosynthesis
VSTTPNRPTGRPSGSPWASAPRAPRVAIIVPCHDEAARLDLVAYGTFLNANRWAALLFVDDGSTDGTGFLLTALRLEHPEQVGVVSLPRNWGKAEAVRRGLREAIAAGYEIVGFWDADLPTPLDAIAELRDVLDARPDLDIAMGSRVRLLGRTVDREPRRHIASRLAGTAAALVLGIPVYDTQCGAKLFRASPALAASLEQPFEAGRMFDVELIARYMRLRAEAGRRADAGIYEVPLDRWVDSRRRRGHVREAFRGAWDLWTIHRQYGPARLVGIPVDEDGEMAPPDVRRAAGAGRR